MKPNDDNLSKLLENWQGIEPRGSLEADVRRRIRLADADRGARSLGEWLNSLLSRPALAAGLAAAVVASVVLGSSVGLLSARAKENPHAELQFMSGGTLAGSYAKLTSEVRR